MHFGNQLALPVGEGFLHVEPIYISSASGTSYPQLRIVVATFAGRVAWGQSLDGALDELFGGDAGVDEGGGGGGDEPPAEPEEPAEPKNLTADEKKLRAAISGMEQAYKEGQDALKKGDFAAYDKAQKELRKHLEDAAEAQPGGGSATLDEG